MDSASIAWQFWYSVRKVAAILEREAEAVIAAGVGISFGQFMVLSVIDAHPGPLNQTAIADHLGLTKATVSRLIDQGSRAGWIDVATDPASRRSRLISLTSQGDDLVRRGDAVLEASRLAAPAVAGPAAIRDATSTLQQIIGTLRDGSGSSHTMLPPTRHPWDA